MLSAERGSPAETQERLGLFVNSCSAGLENFCLSGTVGAALQSGKLQSETGFTGQLEVFKGTSKLRRLIFL